jgi:hypothetical protein
MMAATTRTLTGIEGIDATSCNRMMIGKTESMPKMRLQARTMKRVTKR